MEEGSPYSAGCHWWDVGETAKFIRWTLRIIMPSRDWLNRSCCSTRTERIGGPHYEVRNLEFANLRSYSVSEPDIDGLGHGWGVHNWPDWPRVGS